MQCKHRIKEKCQEIRKMKKIDNFLIKIKKSKMSDNFISRIFIYQWIVEDEKDEIIIRGYGIDHNSKNICIRVKNFKPWLSMEVKNKKLTKLDVKTLLKRHINDNFLIGDHKMKQKLYFDYGKELFKIFPVYFNTLKSRKINYYILQRVKKKLPLKVHDYEASPLLQFLCKYKLPSCGWIKLKKINSVIKNTFTRYSKEYGVDCTSIENLEEEHSIPEMTCVSFDLETYSSDETKHPNFLKKEDEIFQIGVSISKKNVKEKNILFTLSKKEFSLKNSEVRIFESESCLLDNFCNFIKKENPHIIMGYNIFGFDIPYLYHRCRRYGIPIESIGMSKDDERNAEYKQIKWSSSAYSVQEFHYLDLEGRIFIDLLPIVRRDYKLNNYKLKTVGTYFLGETKDPITVKDIFEAYRLGFKGNNIKKILLCGKYCVQDARLVLLLYHKIQCWIGLLEMAKLCNVGIMTLYTQGQQIKVFSQVYRKCYYENRLVDSFHSLEIPENISFDFDKYCGAYVFPPIPGKYQWVIPFDFTSLYPTTIIAYNIDYSTLVIDENFPDSFCHIIDWNEDGKNYRFRFRKEPKGVIPSLLQSLLDQRNITKKLLKETKDNLLKTVLDKRQLAYKISANSMYGAMGVQRGYLPFLPGAMCTTAKGRESIQKAADYVQKKHNGKIIYGDSVDKNSIIYIRYNEDVRIYSIEEYFEKQNNIIPYPQFKPLDKTLEMKQQYIFLNENYKIMTHNGWSPMKRLIRHKTLKEMYKIYTTSGMVVITEDHSLLLSNKRCISPKDLVINEHELLFTNQIKDVSERLYYQKERWNGFYTLYDGKILFDNSIDEKYMSYIYLSYKKVYPKCIYMLRDDKYFLDLLNKNDIAEGLVLKIEKLGKIDDFVYDIETSEGSFHCGTGSLIVKNTDSIYCHFPKYDTPNIVWDKAKYTEIDFLSLFPPPMKLLFEEKIYKDFLILTKKRYMAYTCDENGTIDEKMTIRGVLLARRDNCLWTRLFYEKVVRSIMESKSFDDILFECNKDILKLFYWDEELKDLGLFIITKALNADYKIRELNDDLKKAKKRFVDLDLIFPSSISVQQINKEIQKNNSQCVLDKYEEKIHPIVQDYIDRSKPAHVQLANRMDKRGLPISIGSRMEYIIIEHKDDPSSKLCYKLEDPTYFSNHCSILRLDRLHYLKTIVPSVDQLFEIVFQKKNVIKNIYQYHLNFFKMNKEWKTMNQVKFQYC